MVYNGELIKLNGKVFDCIISYKVGRNKLWGSDTERNMAGSMKGTLIGVFPKIMLEIEPLDSLKMAELEQILDTTSIEVEYYNAKYGCVCKGNFYANDYEEDLLRRTDMKYRSFSVNLISEEKEDSHVRSN